MLAVTLGSQFGAGPRVVVGVRTGRRRCDHGSGQRGRRSCAGHHHGDRAGARGQHRGSHDDRSSHRHRGRQAGDGPGLACPAERRECGQPAAWTAAPSGVPATPQGELQLFSELAKRLRIGEHTSPSPRTRGRGEDARQRPPHEGRQDRRALDFFFDHDTLGYAGDCVTRSERHDLPPTKDGGYVILADDHGGCVNTSDITVVHPDGTAVQIFLASCYKEKDGDNT